MDENAIDGERRDAGAWAGVAPVRAGLAAGARVERLACEVVKDDAPTLTNAMFLYDNRCSKESCRHHSLLALHTTHTHAIQKTDWRQYKLVSQKRGILLGFKRIGFLLHDKCKNESYSSPWCSETSPVSPKLV